MVASRTTNVGLPWVLETQDSGQTFGLVVVLLKSFLNGTRALGLGLTPWWYGTALL